MDTDRRKPGLLSGTRPRLMNPIRHVLGAGQQADLLGLLSQRKCFCTCGAVFTAAFSSFLFFFFSSSGDLRSNLPGAGSHMKRGAGFKSGERGR